MYKQTFSKDYDIIEKDYGLQQETKSPNKINLVERNSEQDTRDRYISVHFPKQIDSQTFSNLRRFKYISIIQPEACYDNEKDEYILIYLIYLKYQLNLERMKKCEIDGHAKRIFLQLALCIIFQLIYLVYAELETREFKWSIEYLEQLYYFDGLLYISLADYNFNSPNLQLSCFEQFMNFTKKHFPVQFSQIQYNNLKNLTNIVKYFCIQNINGFDIYEDRIPYYNVLRDLLQQQKAEFRLLTENVQHANSVVKQFSTPKNLLELHPELRLHNSNDEQQCIVKTTMISNGDNQQLILKRIDREINLMEKNESQYIAVCSLYFRIFNTAFLIMKKYPYTLYQILKQWKPSPETLKRDVYAFSYKFAQALNDLHFQSFLHRDLKPDNLFLNKSELDVSDVFIADLDRAKENDLNINIEQTAWNLDNHPKYNPPEENIDGEKFYTYDVFQYGMIVLEVANRGKYIGTTNGPRLLENSEKFEEFYSPQAITKTLSKYNYDKDFVDLIIQCLSKQPEKRPDSQIIFQNMEKIYYQQVQGMDQTILKTVKQKSKQQIQIQPNVEREQIVQSEIPQNQNQSIQQIKPQIHNDQGNKIDLNILQYYPTNNSKKGQ